MMFSRLRTFSTRSVFSRTSVAVSHKTPFTSFVCALILGTLTTTATYTPQAYAGDLDLDALFGDSKDAQKDKDKDKDKKKNDADKKKALEAMQNTGSNSDGLAPTTDSKKLTEPLSMTVAMFAAKQAEINDRNRCVPLVCNERKCSDPTKKVDRKTVLDDQAFDDLIAPHKLTTWTGTAAPFATTRFTLCFRLSSEIHRPVNLAFSIVTARKKRVGGGTLTADFTSSTKVEHILDMPPLVLPESGDYFFAVDADGVEVARGRLFSLDAPPAP